MIKYRCFKAVSYVFRSTTTVRKVFLLLEKFEVIQPNSKEALFSALEQYRDQQVSLMAGGTDLIPALRDRKKQADYIIDLEGLGLDYIKLIDDEIKIGALTTFRALTRSSVVRQYAPILAKAAGGLGAVQTQNLATVGGNLCSALPSADSATPLLVYDAKLLLTSKNGNREVNVADFHTCARESVLEKGEILEEIIIKVVGSRKASFEKVGRRKGMSLAILNCSTAFCLDENGDIQDARIALGAAAAVPIRVEKAEALLNGNKPTGDLFKQAGQVVYDSINPRSSIRGSAEYRKLLAKALVTRHLEQTLQQFGSN